MGENVHGGHRQRLKDRFLQHGAEGFEKHQLLELLLFFGIPQKDTNPIAHKLLDRFGSIGGGLGASVDDLCTVDGVSTHTATLIKLLPAIWNVAACEVDTSKRYDNVNKIGELLVKRYAAVKVETILLVLLDDYWHILDIVNLNEGSAGKVTLDTRKLVETTIRKNATKALLAHNHPNGNIVPSSDDLITTEKVAEAFKTIHVDFIEHLLVAGNRFEPLLAKTEGAFWREDY